jgi:hypothetical protein
VQLFEASHWLPGLPTPLQLFLEKVRPYGYSLSLNPLAHAAYQSLHATPGWFD